MPLNEGNNKPEWFNNAADITTVVFDQSFQLARPKTCYYWFENCFFLAEIEGIEYLNTSEVTDMSGMFVSCYALKSLDLSSFNTSKVTSMDMMFAFCQALETILVGDGWNVEKVTVSDNMFLDCENLTGGNGFQYDETTSPTPASATHSPPPNLPPCYPTASAWCSRPTTTKKPPTPTMSSPRYRPYPKPPVQRYGHLAAPYS